MTPTERYFHHCGSLPMPVEELRRNWSLGQSGPTPDERRAQAQREEEVRLFLTEYCAHFGVGRNRDDPYVFVKLADPTGRIRNPPLDDKSTDEQVVVEQKSTPRYPFREFDRRKYRGAAVPLWKLMHLRLACGFPHVRHNCNRSGCFQYGWFVYLDDKGDVYRMTLDEIDKLVNLKLSDNLTANVIESVRFDKISDDQALFIPTRFWTKLGNLGNVRKKRTFIRLNECVLRFWYPLLGKGHEWPMTKEAALTASERGLNKIVLPTMTARSQELGLRVEFWQNCPYCGHTITELVGPERSRQCRRCTRTYDPAVAYASQLLYVNNALAEEEPPPALRPGELAKGLAPALANVKNILANYKAAAMREASGA